MTTRDVRATPAMNAAQTMMVANRGRHGVRAPKGGCTVAGKVFRGGQFCLAGFDPANPHGLKVAIMPTVHAAPAFDITRNDIEVSITNPATGNTRVFRVESIESGPMAGKRVVAILDGADRWSPFCWTGFGFVDDFGVKVWRRFAEDRAVVGKAGYIALLTEASRVRGSAGVYGQSLRRDNHDLRDRVHARSVDCHWSRRRALWRYRGQGWWTPNLPPLAR